MHKNATTLPIVPNGSKFSIKRINSVEEDLLVTSLIRFLSATQIPNCLYVLRKSMVFQICFLSARIQGVGQKYCNVIDTKDLQVFTHASRLVDANYAILKSSITLSFSFCCKSNRSAQAAASLCPGSTSIHPFAYVIITRSFALAAKTFALT